MLLAFLLCLLLHTPALAQDRLELANLSSQPWTLALVEGARPGAGTVACIDKFTGKTLVTLAKVGDCATLPPRSRTLLVFQRSSGTLFRGFILRDRFGYYGEFAASLEYLSSRTITVQLVSQHVGNPLDREDDASVRQYLNEAIEVGDRAILIHPNTLEPAPSP